MGNTTNGSTTKKSDVLDRFYADVGQRIRNARVAKKNGVGRLSQTELAKAVSLSRTSIANIERGRQRILLHTLVSVAETLRVDPGTLIPSLTDGTDFTTNLSHKSREFVERVLEQEIKQR